MAKHDRSPAELRSELMQVLDYNADTGEFTWRVKRGKDAIPGKRAGFGRGADGYRRIGALGAVYFEHRLAWLFAYGDWPHMVDHINGVKNDNRLSNLRDASRVLNARNSAVREASAKRLSKGLLPIGVMADEVDGGWRAHIRFDGVSIYSGSLPSMEAASEMFMKLKLRLHDGYMGR